MNKHFFIALWATALLAACTNNDEPLLGGPVETIDATASLEGLTVMPVSRAIVNGLPQNTNKLEVAFARLDETAKDTYPADYAGVAAASPATIDNAGKVAFTPTLYYLTNKEVDETKLVGWYPAGTYSAGVVTFAIDGKTDVMLSNEKAGSLTSKFGTADFTFNHLLAQIVVKVYAADDASAGAAGKWGKITKIEVTDQPNECKVTLPATVTTTGNPANRSLTLKNADADMAEVTLVKKASAAEAVECGYALIAPTTGKTINLKVTTDTGIEQTVAATLVTTAGYAKSLKYTIVLKFSVAGIEPADTTIGPWTDSTDNPGEITM